MTTETSEAERIAEAVRGAPAVVELSGGSLGGIGTYLPGRRVIGVQLHDAVVEVHVVGRYGSSVSEIAAQVRCAVAPLARDRRVDVTVEDLA